MVLSYFFNADETSFDDQLLKDIKEKDNEKLDTLLENSKDLYSAIDASGASLLHYAAEFGNENIVSHLIKSGSKMNLQNNEGYTPLLLAAKGQHAATIRVLLESDADMYICDNEGNNALKAVLLAQPTNVEIAKIFLDQLDSECSSNFSEIAEKLIEINCPLYVAAIFKHFNVTYCMISDGCPIDTKDPITDRTALHVAVENSDWKQADILMALGANVNAKDTSGKTPLAMLKHFDDDPQDQLYVLEYLIDAKAELTLCDNEGLMQMHWILKNGPKEAVEMILKNDFDVTATDQYKQNILHYLSHNVDEGIVEVIEEKLEFGKIDLNARDEDGTTALHCAIMIANTKFVEFLSKNGANVNIANNRGITPFLQAIESATESTMDKHVKCVKLLEKGVFYVDVAIGNYFKLYNTKSAINRNFLLLEPVIASLAIHQTVGDELSQTILNRIESHPKLKEYFDVCMSELKRMKEEFIWKEISLFDALKRFHLNEQVLSGLDVIEERFTAYNINKLAKKYQLISVYHEMLDEIVCILKVWKEKDEKFLNKFSWIVLAVMVISVLFILILHRYDEKFAVLFASFVICVLLFVMLPILVVLSYFRHSTS